MKRKNIKITCYVAIAIFLFLRIPFFNLKPMTSASYAVSVSALLHYFYDLILWRFNPFEKIPHIYGTYSEFSESTYLNGYPYTAKAVIHQTLTNITVYEEIENTGYAESITAALIPPSTPDGRWKLYYTYLTHPTAIIQDDMHEGTVVLQIKDENTLEGTYYTNRINSTNGSQKLVKISNRTK